LVYTVINYDDNIRCTFLNISQESELLSFFTAEYPYYTVVGTTCWVYWL